jgi:uridylate kinase
LPVKYRRILLKVSGEILGQNADTLNKRTIEYIVREIISARELGVKIGVVVGGGNIIRGKTARWMDRVDADFCGMLATVINGLALHSKLEGERVPSYLSSGLPVSGVAPGFSRAEDHDHYNSGGVMIFVGGTGNPLFTTDTAAALRAVEMNADLLIKGTRVEGVFSADPEKSRNARLFKKLEFEEAIRKELKVMDSTAFSICRDARIPICVYNLMKYPLKSVVTGKRIGTIVG